jgi:preprotein translocase subunit SecG
MLLSVLVGLLSVTNICFSVGLIVIVLLQRGEDGAFSRSTIHNVIRASINTLFSKTWKLAIAYVIHTIIFGLVIAAHYYNLEYNLQYKTIIINK